MSVSRMAERPTDPTLGQPHLVIGPATIRDVSSSDDRTPSLIEQLSDPASFPGRPGHVEIRQTHISIVALADQVVYKLRKAVDLGFVDFSTLEKRRLDCLEEVRLNRRLARDVYLGVVPIVRTEAGLRLEGEGEPIEWAVKMQRLPDGASLLASIERGELTKAVLATVAKRIAAFHAGASRNAQKCNGGFATIAANARQNFEQIAPDVGVTVSARVFEAVRSRTEEHLERLRPLMESRALRGVPCDGHGDLRLEHIYSFPDQPPPADVVVIDCVEFSEQFRFGDPVGDAAFLGMELLFHDCRDLARAFEEAYFRALSDDEGRMLLPYYVAYRSIVRGKVRGIEVREREIDARRRESSLAKARAHFLLALGVLEKPEQRPALVLVGGLPGTGKSTLARELSASAHFEVIRSDEVRKELAGIASAMPAGAAYEAGIYTPEWTERTYEECRRRAEARLLEGRRVVVDATFAREAQRGSFIDTARRLSVPVLLFVCNAEEERVRGRLASRRGDASDADVAIYERSKEHWEPPAQNASGRALVEIDTDAGARAALEQALAALGARDLWGH